jgi:hypothetical protein
VLTPNANIREDHFGLWNPHRSDGWAAGNPVRRD